jgi:hypothetical protein
LSRASASLACVALAAALLGQAACPSTLPPERDTVPAVPSPNASAAPALAAPSSRATAEPVPKASASSAGSAPATEDLELFLEAADTDVEAPYPRDDKASRKLYGEAASRLIGEQAAQWDPPASSVAFALARTSDPRGPAALAAWAARPSTLRWHRLIALHEMGQRPRAEYLAAVKAILANDALASELSSSQDLGLYSDAVGLRGMGSTWASALTVAAAIGSDEARAFVREVALDRTRSAPDPRTLAALVCDRSDKRGRCPEAESRPHDPMARYCGQGRRRVEDEARALSSVRLIALAILGDIALAQAIANDATEPAFIRRWAGNLAKGRGPYAKKREREARESEREFELVNSPCR